MDNLKRFSKSEIISLALIFIILIGVSLPNFIVSLRRARDQVRRDDLGALVHSLDEYYAELGAFPPSSPDGKIMDCLKPGDSPYQDKKGRWIFSPISCEWGKDAFMNLISGKAYMTILPREPHWEEGASYRYISDGERYQLFAAMEGKNEAEVDPKILAKNLSCGNKICSVGRSYACDIPKTIEQCNDEAQQLGK